MTELDKMNNETKKQDLQTISEVIRSYRKRYTVPELEAAIKTGFTKYETEEKFHRSKAKKKTSI